MSCVSSLALFVSPQFTIVRRRLDQVERDDVVRLHRLSRRLGRWSGWYPALSARLRRRDEHDVGLDVVGRVVRGTRHADATSALEEEVGRRIQHRHRHQRRDLRDRHRAGRDRRQEPLGVGNAIEAGATGSTRCLWRCAAPPRRHPGCLRARSGRRPSPEIVGILLRGCRKNA